MNPKLKPAKTLAEIQIDLIAKLVPSELQADFYREMTYCRSLAENDEMLHILNILQILTVVMVDVPTRIAAERDQIETDLRDTRMQLRESLAGSRAYQKQIDERLAQLPHEIAKGINPSTIAASINESLRSSSSRRPFLRPPKRFRLCPSSCARLQQSSEPTHSVSATLTMARRATRERQSPNYMSPFRHPPNAQEKPQINCRSHTTTLIVGPFMHSPEAAPLSACCSSSR
jgi:hypothetical protein